MSNIPFASLSNDGQSYDDGYSGESSVVSNVASSSSLVHDSFVTRQQTSRETKDETSSLDLHNSDSEDLNEAGDIGIGEPSYASYQKSGRNTYPGKMSEVDGFDDDDFVDINSSLNARKNKSYAWYRHPQVRENWKTVTGAILLLILGIGFLICAIVLSAIPDHDGPKAVIFYVCAAVCILPGGYHTVYIYRATKGWRGYNFESLPNFH